MQLENEVWQQIPGTRSSWVYPFVRKPSITGSNTYIIRSGRHLLVIDPGAIHDQMEKIRTILTNEVSGPDHPIIIIAGHIHVDHMYLGISDRRLREIGRVIIAAEDWGACQIEAGDPYWTGADITGLPQSKAQVELHLLTPEDKTGEKTRVVRIPGFDEMTLVSHQIQCEDRIFYGQSMPLADGDRIEFWHTPGHSPDSLTIRIGSLIHIGDIPFSTNPGIAGRAGWNRDDLLVSALNINHHLLRDEEVICCIGHGRDMNQDTAKVLMNRLVQEVKAMPEISPFTIERLNLSLWHGLDLIEEAHRIFPVIAGRMMSLCFHLEYLGMKKEADELSTLFEYESVERLLDEFNLFYDEYKAGKKIKPEVVLKTLQILTKIQQSFPAESLDVVMDSSLIRRVTRNLSDFLGTIQGIIPEGRPEQINLIPLIHQVFSVQNSLGVSDDELISTADDEEAYQRAIVSRLAHHPHAHNLSCSVLVLEGGDENWEIQADHLRLFDFFITLIEYFKRIQTESLEIALKKSENDVMMILTPQGAQVRSELPLPGATLREVAYAGGTLLSVMEPGKEDIRISFSRS